MAGFGGSVKLTGESEYRKAIQNITQDLKSLSSQLKAQTADYNANDKSVSNSVNKQKELNDALQKQQAEISKAKSAYAQFSVAVQTQQTRHNALSKEYKQAVLELDRIGKASGTTSDEYKKQAEVVDKLGKELSESTEELNESKSAMQALKSEINSSSKVITNASDNIDDLGKEAKEAGDDAEEGSDGFTVFKAVVADLASKAIQSAINGLKQLGGAVINVGKQAYSSYAEYEQLVGGVETLFGDSADELIKYANVAYKTAGLSANQYMEQATSFSATLLQGLGGDTKKAVEYANMAIIDMSDNANKMGTDMTMIQNAYQGFAKDNYTMLDNLKLGYGGTQTEMARLINDSGVLGDAIEVTAETVKDVPFDKIIEAIHKTQQEIGITGTTTLEAEKTISGSTASMRGAWENLLVGIANGDADISPLLDDLVQQVIVMGQNMIPRVKQIIEGMGELVSEVWNEVIPKLAEEIPQLQPIVNAMNWIKDNADIIISGLAGILAGFMAFKTVTFIMGIVSAVQGLFTAIQAGIPIMQALNLTLNANPIALIITAVVGLVTAFVTLWNTSEEFRNFWIDLWEQIKTTFTAVWDTVTGFFTETLPEAFNSVKEKIGEWKDNIVEFFQAIPEKAKEIVQNVITFFKELPYNLGLIIGQALGHIIKFGQDAWKWVTTKVPEIINGIVNFFKELPSKIWTWLQSAFTKIATWGSNAIAKAKETGSNFISSVISFVQQLPSRLWTWLTSAISKVGQFARDIASKAKEGAKNMFDNVVNGIKDLPNKIMTIGGDIVKGLWNGIKGMKDWVLDKIKGFGKGLLDGLKGVLGIKSPSKLFRDEVGFNIAQGIGVGFTDEMENVTKQMQDAIPTNFDVNSSLNGVSGSRSDFVFNSMVDAFKEALSQVKVELDDDEVGRFVDNTVTRLVYN